MIRRYQTLAGVLGLFLLFFVGTAIYFFYHSPISADEPQITRQLTKLSLEPDSLTVSVGEAGKININVSNGAGARLVRFRLTFSGGVKVDRFVPSLALTARPEVKIDKVNGSVSFEGQVVASNNNFSLGSLTFTAISAGPAKIEFDQSFLPPAVFLGGQSRLPALAGATLTVR